MEKVTDAGYESLAAAIVAQACVDYKHALRNIAIGRKVPEAQMRIAECTRFFHSDQFKVLSPDIDGDYMIKWIKENTWNI